MEITLEQLKAATGSDTENAATYLDPIQLALDRFHIETPTQVSAFLATVAIESARLSAVQESLYYRDAERLAKLFRRVFDTNKDKVISQDEIEAARPYCRMPKELSRKLYNGYHGRGLIQLTWEENYRAAGRALGFDYVSDPDMVCLPLHAALTAGWFWDSKGLNDVADNMDEVTLRVNGKLRLHLAERIAQRDVALTVLA